MTKEINRLVCSIAMGYPIKEALDEGKIMPCHECGVEVIVSPFGQKMLVEKEAYPVCGPCANKVPPGDRDIMPPNEEQLAALKEMGLSDEELDYMKNNFEEFINQNLPRLGKETKQ